MEFKGTKGRWEIAVLPNSEKFGVIKIGKSYLEYNGIDASVTDEQEKSDLLLISKAPEMLEMLKELRETLREYDGWREEFYKIEQLIKEATEF